MTLNLKLELIAVPVSDVDRAKAFSTDLVGFVADLDHRVSDELRFVQLTPPGSACWRGDGGPAGGPFAFFQDPDGNAWLLQQTRPS